MTHSPTGDFQPASASQSAAQTEVGSATTDAAAAYPFTLSEEQWRERLDPMEFAVLRQAGTEPAFSGPYVTTKRVGVYRCRGCESELFRSETKFDSHCGWPSFFSPLAGERIIERVDNSHGMVRTEVLCANCGSHLGHVFAGEGYATPTDLRYCINSVSLNFEAEPVTQG